MAAPNCALKVYATPTNDEPHSSVVRPTLEEKSFELKPYLLSMVQQNQFPSSPTDDPNLHMFILLNFVTQ